MTTTLFTDKIEGNYKKDILLFVHLSVKQKKREDFEIMCPYSKKTYNFNTVDAEKWVKAIKKVLLDKRGDGDEEA